MPNPDSKHPKNVPGPWYCTDAHDQDGEGCTACGCCYVNAPDYFGEDENGFGYVKRQPRSEAEVRICIEAMRGCLFQAIGNDG